MDTASQSDTSDSGNCELDNTMNIPNKVCMLVPMGVRRGEKVYALREI